MTGSISIRPYSPADTDRLVAIWLEASRIGHPFLTEKDLTGQLGKIRDIYLPKAENHVLATDGITVGFIGLIENFIGGLFIAPSYHRNGFGRLLVEHAAALKGELEVEVYRDNREAVAFYERTGFLHLYEQPSDSEGRPLSVLRMHRPQPAT